MISDDMLVFCRKKLDAWSNDSHIGDGYVWSRLEFRGGRKCPLFHPLTLPL